MKIYLNERIIRLVRNRPSGNDYHMVDSRKEISLLYHAFEADPTQKRIVLFSTDYPRLKQSFLSLFNVVEAAGGLVRNEADEVLFIFRRGHWDLPKGKLNRKEDVTEARPDAAVREVMEETGARNLTITGKRGRTCHIFFEKRVRYLKKTYWFEMTAPKEQNLVPQAEEDITEVRWIPSAEIPAIKDQLYPSLKKLLKL